MMHLWYNDNILVTGLAGWINCLNSKSVYISFHTSVCCTLPSLTFKSLESKTSSSQILEITKKIPTYSLYLKSIVNWRRTKWNNCFLSISKWTKKTSRPRILVSGVKMSVAIDKLGLRFHLILTLSFSQPQREVLPSTTHISLERSICMEEAWHYWCQTRLNLIHSRRKCMIWMDAVQPDQ